MYSVLSTPSLWWSRVIWEKFKNFHKFCAVEQYKNNGKKSLRIQDLAIQNLWETHMLGHSLSSGTIESTAHQDQPQTSWLFEGISHFRDGLRMMELHVSQFWLSPHLQHWYNCFPMYGWGDPPKPATGLMKDTVSLCDPTLAPDTISVPSGSGSAISLHVSTLFPFLEFAECLWLLWSDLWGQPYLRAGCGPASHQISLPISPPPTKWKRMTCIFSPLTPGLVQDSAHSALGLPLYLRGCLGQSSGSISAWILANPVSIPVTWAYFLGGFEALHRIGVLSTIEKKWGRKVGKNPTLLGVRDFWTHRLSSLVGVAKVL